MIQELPLELFGEIIGHLWDDKSTLCTCSLVCKGLTGPSQRLLFSCIILRAPRALILERYASSFSGISSDFLRLLDASPHISEYVDCLQILDIETQESEMGDSEPTQVEDESLEDNSEESQLGNLQSVENAEHITEISQEMEVEVAGTNNSPGNDENDSSTIDSDVNGGDDDDDEDDDIMGYNQWLTNDKSLPLILPRLQNLKAFIVDFVFSWKRLSEEIRTSLLRVLQLPSLRYVEFSPFPIELLTEPIHENVKHLNMRFSSMTKAVKNVLIPGPGTFGLIYPDSLYVSDIDAFIAFMESNPDCRFKPDRLRRLALEIEQDGFFSSWILLQNCCRTLEEFIFIPVLEIPSSSTLTDYQEVIQLHKLVSLRELTIEIRTTSAAPLNWWLSKFFRASSSPNLRLENIAIHVYYRSEVPADVDLHHWDDISDALVSNMFPSLKRVHISIASVRNRDCARHIADRLKMYEHIAALQSRRDIDVEIRHRSYNQDTFQFAPNNHWQNIAMTDLILDEDVDADDEVG